MKVQLGDKVKDIVTGFEGIATSICEWLNGCIRVGVQPQSLHEGKPIDAQTFDVEQLEVLEAGKVKTKQRTTGGDRPNQLQRKDITR